MELYPKKLSVRVLIFILVAGLIILAGYTGQAVQNGTVALAAPLEQMTESNVVEVGLTEFEINMPDSLPAGPTTFEVTNNGSFVHNLEIEGEGIEEVFDSNLQSGESGTLEVDLPPGTYRVYCPVGNHAAQGMELTLTVTETAQEEEAPTPEPNEVEVGLTEFEINMPDSLPAGPTTFEVTNNGSFVHNFEIEGAGIEAVFDSNLEAGESGTLEVDLSPGTYRVYCPVGNHAAQGMELTLTVTEAMEQEEAPTPTPEPTPTPDEGDEDEGLYGYDYSTHQVAVPGGDLPGDLSVELVKVADGLIDPINVVSPPDGSGRLFVVERPGRVRIVENGQVLEEPFLDISSSVLSAFLEQGLYDLEFHPDFAQNGLFYVHFSELMRNGDSMIVQYQVAADSPNQADPDSAKVILQIDQPWANHNGGELAFGPDGYLYIGSGDGGWEGDPLEAGQDLATLLGKILRIDVNVSDNRPYAIPPDNPFAQPPELVRLFGISEAEFARIHTEARPEIWAYGLRNPWKFNFDPATGDLYIADVGQNEWEEIDFQPAASQGGENYGWDFLMGSHCFPIQAEECDQVGILPAAEYSHDIGCAVVGIGVYRGDEFAAMDGIYFSGDYCSGRIWGLARNEAEEWAFEELLDTDLQLTGAGMDEAGNLYVTSCNCSYGGPNAFENPPGALWRLVPSDQVSAGAETAPTGSGS